MGLRKLRAQRHPKVTGAALIMVAVFAGLAAGQLVMFQQIQMRSRRAL